MLKLDLTRKHSSRMRIAHLLTVVEGVSQGVCMCSGVCVHGGVQRSVSRGVCPEGDVCPGE